MWKCECSDAGFADDWAGEHLFRKLEKLQYDS
jgi:hypothetical protein